MSQYVGIEPKEYPRIHCAPEILAEVLASLPPRVMAEASEIKAEKVGDGIVVSFDPPIILLKSGEQ